MAESTVLVVDDEPLIVDFLAENLRADDYAVLTAGSGTEAMLVLRETRPDVVLLDIVLPDVSGYEVCRMVREGDRVNDHWDPDIPIIMLSAKAEETDRVRGLTRGADDYITKPSAYLSGGGSSATPEIGIHPSTGSPSAAPSRSRGIT